MLQNSKLQMQPQAVPVSDFSILTNPTSRKTVASSDLDNDPSPGLDSVWVISQGFRGPSSHQWNQTILQNFKLQMQPQALHVSDFSILPKPAFRKTVASYDMAHDPSASLDFGGLIAKDFRGPFLINTSYHDFEKLDKERKMSSQLWLYMLGYRNYITYAGRKLNNLMWILMSGYRIYISYRYVFISSFVSLTKYTGRKLNTLIWLCMAG